MPDAELSDLDFGRFRTLIYQVAGIQIPPTKKVMVTNRLRRRLRATGIASFADYYAQLTSPSGAAEMPSFLDAITTNETYFYRDAHHFDWLDQTFLPEFARDVKPRNRPLRIWSAACATGEEAYSIALKVANHRASLAGREVTILGTDLSGAALELARQASYDDRAVHLVSLAERQKAFDLDPVRQRWTPRAEVRALVAWKRHNLLKPLSAEPFDCIFIKNVLIYFDLASKQVVVRHLLSLLAEGGALVVGPTEGISSMLGSLTKHKTWLYQKPV